MSAYSAFPGGEAREGDHVGDERQALCLEGSWVENRKGVIKEYWDETCSQLITGEHIWKVTIDASYSPQMEATGQTCPPMEARSATREWSVDELSPGLGPAPLAEGQSCSRQNPGCREPCRASDPLRQRRLNSSVKKERERGGDLRKKKGPSCISTNYNSRKFFKPRRTRWKKAPRGSGTLNTESPSDTIRKSLLINIKVVL